MSNTCGTCRHFDHKGNIVASTSLVGTCERENWTEVPLNVRKGSHYRHVLSADHPAPPCHESKAKRVKIRDWTTTSDVKTVGKALDDIRKGEEVIIE